MAARVFAAMSRAGISVVLITQSSSEYSISFCVPQGDCARAQRAMQDEFYLELKEGLLEPLAVTERLAIISVGWRRYAHAARHLGEVLCGAGAREYQYCRDCAGLVRTIDFGGRE